MGALGWNQTLFYKVIAGHYEQLSVFGELGRDKVYNKCDGLLSILV